MRGFAESWKTKVDRKPKMGEEFIFPALCGPSKFRVVEDRGDHFIVESGDFQGTIVRDEDGEWQFKHCLIPKNMKCRATISNAKPTPSPMNSNIGFKKTYK